MSHSGGGVDTGGSCVRMGAGTIREISIPLNFAMSPKLLKKIKSSKYFNIFLKSIQKIPSETKINKSLL